MTTESRPHTVADVMALDLVVVRATAPIEQAAELMDRHHVSGLPVVGTPARSSASSARPISSAPARPNIYGRTGRASRSDI